MNVIIAFLIKTTWGEWRFAEKVLLSIWCDLGRAVRSLWQHVLDVVEGTPPYRGLSLATNSDTPVLRCIIENFRQKKWGDVSHLSHTRVWKGDKFLLPGIQWRRMDGNKSSVTLYGLFHIFGTELNYLFRGAEGTAIKEAPSLCCWLLWLD